MMIMHQLHYCLGYLIIKHYKKKNTEEWSVPADKLGAAMLEAHLGKMELAYFGMHSHYESEYFIHRKVVVA